MRKLVFLMVISLVVAFAVPAGAKVVVNEKHQQYEINAVWSVETEERDEHTEVWAVDGDQGSWFQIDYEDDRKWDCSDGPGMLRQSIHGWGVVDTLTVDPLKGKDKFTTGNATGTFVDGYARSYWCDGTLDFYHDLSGESFEFYLDGTEGSLAKVTSSDSFHIPGEENFHQRGRGEVRSAVGSAIIGGWRLFSPLDGSIGFYTWTSHSNTK